MKGKEVIQMPNKMTDAEYGKHIREMNAKYLARWNARQAIFKRKIASAKISVTKAEVDAEMAKK